MFSKFFINRPVFASVISIIIVIAGLMGLNAISVEEYPSLTPPQIVVQASYPGADAATIASTVATPIEDAINGVEDMIYMQSVSSSAGTLSVNVYFEIGTDPMEASVNINNRVSAIEAKLPDEVRRLGVNVSERSSDILEVISFFTPDGKMDPTTLNNYININIAEELKRVPGVGNIAVIGGKDYAVKIWVKPEKLHQYKLTTTDIIAKVNEQNSQYAAGKLGEAPMSSDVPYVYTLKVEGRLKNIDEFKNIILKSTNNGNIVRLSDVADVKLQAQSYNFTGKYNGDKDMIPVLIFMQNGANAIATANAVNEKVQQMSKEFPSSLSYDIVYDTTKFVEVSMQEVSKTFIEAIVLVLLVIYMFLKNIRATIIPMIAVPVAILGTFGVLYAIGFTMNLITLFALLLSIGIVVDDAIIVIENVERILRSNEHLSPKQASIMAMQEVATPIISIVLVLSAVFAPVAFLDGFAGQIQKQFALTLVSSVIISGFVALTLTPALCGVFLKHQEIKPFYIVRKFNDFFDWSTKIFSAGVSKVLRHIIPSILVILIMFYAIYRLFGIIPSSLVPNEDKGSLISIVSLPPASTLARTQKEVNKITNVVLQNPNMTLVGAMIGYDIQSGSLKEDSAVMFMHTTDWDQRKDANQSSFSIANLYNGMFYQDPGSQAFFINPPPISGMGLADGFEVYLQNKLGKDYNDIAVDVQKVLNVARTKPQLNAIRLNSTLVTNVPQYNISIDKNKAKMLNVNINDIYNTLSATVGQYYINDFNMFGKTYKVNIQAEEKYRKDTKNLHNIFVRSVNGNMIPITTLVKFEKSTGPATVERFNLYPSAKLSGSAAAGYTSSDAIKAIEDSVFEVLSKDEYSLGWSGASYQEVNSAGTGTKAFVFGLIFVFLILAAQYERWIIPFAIIAAVPFAVFGSLVAVYFGGQSNDIYFQIGLLVLIGLSAKNAILIIEFAMEARRKGLSIFDASLQASKLRFRPIIMTSLAFTLGVLPMILSTGAGAASRHALGTGVVGGMIVASSVALFFIPLFFYLAENFSEWLAKKMHKNQHVIAKEKSDV